MDSNYLYTTTSNVGIVDSTDVIIDPATEQGQQGIVTAIENQPKTAGGANLVGNAKTKWRFEGRTWGGASDEIWDLIQTGSGMTIGADGTSGGARYLKITTGVTTNSETIIMSKEAFRPPLNFSFGLTMSQRIANQEVHIELVEVDDNGDVVLDTEFFTSPNFNNARSGVGLKYDGTSANNASIKVRSRGISELVKAAASHGTNFSLGAGTSPNFNPTLQGEISFTADRVVTAGRTIDSNASRTEGGRSTAYVPDPDVAYKIRLRVKNLGTAPASTTDVRLHFGKVIDQTRLSVDFGAIAGSLNGSDAIPVYLMNPTSTSVTIASPSTANGNSTHATYVSAATVNNTLVKNTVGVISNIELSNNSTSWRYLKLYNKATAPVAGTDTPVKQIGIPPGQTICAAFSIPFNRFATGIGFAITANPALNDNTAIGANEVIVSISYT